MSKEKLIELKKKLERKYVGYDGTGTFEEITQFEIEQKKNEQGAISNLDNYFTNLITNLSLNGKMYDELMISAVYRLFYKKEDINDDMGMPNECAKPLQDFVVVSFGCYKAINGNESYDSDPEEIYDGCYDEFIVSFNDLKIALEQNGFDIGTIKSFEEIESITNDGRIPVTFLPIQFYKTKKLTKE